jgi:hypothetical protein
LGEKDCSCEVRALFQQSTVTEAANFSEYGNSVLGKVSLGRINVKFLTAILLKDLCSRKVRCSANSMGSRWSNSRQAFPFLDTFFLCVTLLIQS